MVGKEGEPHFPYSRDIPVYFPGGIQLRLVSRHIPLGISTTFQDESDPQFIETREGSCLALLSPKLQDDRSGLLFKAAILGRPEIYDLYRLRTKSREDGIRMLGRFVDIQLKYESAVSRLNGRKMPTLRQISEASRDLIMSEIRYVGLEDGNNSVASHVFRYHADVLIRKIYGDF